MNYENKSLKQLEHIRTTELVDHEYFKQKEKERYFAKLAMLDKLIKEKQVDECNKMLIKESAKVRAKFNKLKIK